MITRRLIRTAGVAVAAAAAVLGMPSISSATQAPSLVYVSAHNYSGGPECETTAVHSIQAGVDAVAPGGTVVVCPGVYKESVTVTKPLTLQHQGPTASIVDATGQSYGIAIGADHVTVTGLTVRNAGVGLDPSTCGAGPTAPLCAGIVTFAAAGGPPVPGNYATVTHNVLTGNVGFGVDVVSTHDSVFRYNRSNGNGIGVNVVDDLGIPVQNNTIANNQASGNKNGCGIALASHSGAGVIGNLVQSNVADGNGLPAGGAGILLATPTPGGIVRGNSLVGNTASGNGHAGIEVHIHVGQGATPPSTNADASGNSIVGNTIGTNNTGGDYDDPHTTGIYLGSNSPMSIVVKNNHISHDVNGIFKAGPNVTAVRSGNTFTAVTHPYVVDPTFA